MKRTPNEFRRGIETAAAYADNYNASSAHKYRLGDCILGKFNMRKGKPRRNRLAQPDANDTAIAAIALALAEVHRHAGCSSAVVQVMRDAGITIARAREAGAENYDLRELRKAGVR